MSQRTTWSAALGGLNGSLAMAIVMSTMLITARPMQGQDPTRIVQPDSQKQAPDTTAPRRTAPLFSGKDALIAAGFGVATIMLFQSDRHVAIQFQDEVTQANHFLRNFTGPAESLAYPGGVIIEGGLYAVGRLAHKQRMAEVGWHSAEAIIVATAATNVLKKVIGRARPYVSGDPHDFQFLGGLKVNHDRSSFPSGHSTTAFAFAAAVASESRTKWPDKWWSEWLIPVGTYGGATIVGVSRLYKNQHWASDVVLGAAIGTFSGIKVIQYAHTYPNNRFDRFMLGTRVVPLAHGGLLLAWSSAP